MQQTYDKNEYSEHNNHDSSSVHINILAVLTKEWHTD